MRASKKDKETLLFYTGWNVAHRFCRKNQNQNKKRYPKSGMLDYLYEENSDNNIEIQL